MKRVIAAVFAVLTCTGTEAAMAQGSYGSNVALVEGTVFVAQPVSTVRAGRVFVYSPSGGEWTESAQLTAAEAAPADGFGYSLAASGSLLLVGQPAHDAGRGTVHVFERRGQAWTHATTLTPQAAAAGDSIGVAVAMHGDAAIIGGAGSAYIFRRSGSGWTQEAVLAGSDAAAGDGFGRAVAINANRAIVGAPMQAENRGAAYLFDRAANGWTETSKLLARTVTTGSALGARVALLRDYGIAAAPGRDEGTGAVYLFEKNPQADGWAAFTRLFPSFGCSGNVQLQSFLPINELGGGRGVGLNDIWGWTDPQTDREYALVGRSNGTSFVDVTDPSNPAISATCR
jgi:hypothetical protein